MVNQFLPQLEVQFLPSTVKSLVPEPILSIVQSVLPLELFPNQTLSSHSRQQSFLTSLRPPPLR